MADHLRLLDAGECALLIEFEVGAETSVLALDATLAKEPIHGLLECVPGWRTLLLHYDPALISRAQLAAAVERLPLGEDETEDAALWRVPICFSGDYGRELRDVAATLELRLEQLIEALCANRLRLVMYGFAPGFAYLSGLDPALSLPRRRQIIGEMPAGSFIIAAGQAALSPVAMPTGWYIVGRTPLCLFDPQRRPIMPFKPGDHLQLTAVSEAGFAHSSPQPEQIEQ